MRRFTLIAAALVAVLALVAACGDDDGDGDGSPTGSPTGTAAPTATPDGTGAEPTNGNGDNGDVTTPPDEKTPIGNGDGETPAPTETIDATPAPEGIPATHIPEITEWLQENYPGVSPSETGCTYNPATVIATCDGVQYAVDPPLTGQDVNCFALRVNDEPVAIRCTSQQPLTTIFYEIGG